MIYNKSPEVSILMALDAGKLFCYQSGLEDASNLLPEITAISGEKL
jgi:hypothetical protein